MTLRIAVKPGIVDTLEGVEVPNLELSCQEVLTFDIEFIRTELMCMGWAEDEMAKLDKEREERQTGDFTSISQLCPRGNTELEVLNEKPEQIDGEFGNQAIFKTRKKDDTGEIQDYKMTVKIQSPTYRDIVFKMKDGKEGEYVPIKVMRIGEQKKTRYEIE